ncbi:MAG: cytochrome C, partial [Chthoniobacterales bacterium]
QPGGAAPHFGENSNFAVSQTSLFYAGRLFGPYAESIFGASAANVLNKFGVFGQVTFDGVGRVLSWDNMELRYADSTTIGDHPLTYGFFLNNNPGLQDLWNSTPAWGFPFSSSPLGPTPGAATLIDGGLSQQVVGAGAYVMLSNSVYVELAGYHTLSVPFQRAVGVAPEGETQVSGLAPYWRLAYTKALGNQSFEIGTFGIAADSYPGRNKSAGHDSTLDWGVDAQYQLAEGRHDLIATASSIYEHNSWDASRRLGNTANSTGNLWTAKANFDYLYDKTYGVAAGYFFADGKDDSALYPDNVRGNPLSDGVVLQVNYLPFNKNGGPSFWPKSNLKLSAQYIIYNRFNGARHNIDGAGRNASDNDTLYLQAWLAF